MASLLTFLDVPRVAQSAVRAGPLRRDAARVESLLLDPERTLLLPVSLAEELPAEEVARVSARGADESIGPGGPQLEAGREGGVGQALSPGSSRTGGGDRSRPPAARR